MKLRPVKTLNGERTFCGPSVISAITGFPVALICEVINRHRLERRESTRIDVGGMHFYEVNDCLRTYGYKALPTEMNVPLFFNGSKPTIARWIKQRKDRNELNLVDAGNHYQLIKGVKFVDSFTKVPVFIRKAPHRRSRGASVWKIIRCGKQRIYRG